MREFPTVRMPPKQLPFSAPYSTKARALLYAHLHRHPLPPDTLARGAPHTCGWLAGICPSCYAWVYKLSYKRTVQSTCAWLWHGSLRNRLRVIGSGLDPQYLQTRSDPRSRVYSAVALCGEQIASSWFALSRSCSASSPTISPPFSAYLTCVCTFS